jgi:predicted nuclease with TOPRIM domain
MTLVELFADYIENRKDLREYVEKRKELNERGEFNDTKLITAQENLERLKKENLKTYEQMYMILDKIIKSDTGYYVEYHINFIKAILKLYRGHATPEDVCNAYAKEIKHRYRDA